MGQIQSSASDETRFAHDGAFAFRAKHSHDTAHPNLMNSAFVRFAFPISCLLASVTSAAPNPGENPADHLPPHIVRLTAFGERADWSADGKKILFLSKTFGDAMEMDLATRSIRNLTAHYPHYGYTRALYLANGDILLSGPEVFDPKRAAQARNECFLSVLDQSGKKPPVALGARCNEGPAVSRHRLHIAWSEWTPPKPGEGDLSASKLFEADLVYTNGIPALATRRLIIDSSDLSFKCTMETQNFRPPEEKELTFSAYTKGGGGCDVLSINLETKKITNYTHSPETYDEPEGIFPDGRYTLVECDQQNHLGSGNVDLWKLALDGSGTYTRLTFFSDYPNYKASNPVVSDDGKFIAFQMGKSGESAGVGHGLFLYSIEEAARTHTP